MMNKCLIDAKDDGDISHLEETKGKISLDILFSVNAISMG